MGYLSRFFQQDNLDFSQVQSAVEGTIDHIRATYLDDCEADNMGGEHLTTCILEMTNPLIFELRKSSSDEQHCYTSMGSFADAIVRNIEERFPDLPLWSSFRIFDPQSYPSKTIQLRGFGNEEVSILLDHSKVVGSQQFNELINPSEFQKEWPIFKRSVFDNYRVKELVKEIFTKRKTSFPVISRLLEFIVVLPMSSVPCERGFSKHNRIRTKFRQQLVVGLSFVNGPNTERVDYYNKGKR